MNFFITLIIGFAASRAAHSTFPGSRWVSTLTLGLGGAVVGGLISVIEPFAGFAPMNIFWSTLGAVVALAGGVVARRAEHAQFPENIES